ncbi:hypothetical protein SS1G_11256 [Sclerotinia sclerotiorum 1980 UF-70]|uniref:AP-3 complex subunit delta n=1 Tax=Sclerotinia sclerotiorum (strain ATCC 18683 / 1980 / Ss-1) TaxID=665079 RepID=A7F0Y7_SCLS1|nr:hypothetical protein SS1G_11256 [Sclerotinia sclerotiorum 1980 UF-70]EDN95379.1 hypothetical protein SS1G_11256 [Sclerotinia sclerotiorum 1980 UF-70]
MSLPIITLPHVITPSLALSVLSDLLPRMTHSHPAIRKKTIVTLYRLALVYPETLRPAWPKIKERLMDEGEDPSVTAAIVNVFATLTPLEPRLVKKLLPPLTSIIRTTPAMSLLYECINGIILGGILGSSEESAGGEEIATLCVSKLRGMIMVEGDPNLKYVALLAFNKIVVTHPFLVAQQEDVIMDCIDSADISIRLRALDLVVGMVSSDNLMSIVGRLMRQLRSSPSIPARNSSPRHAGHIEPEADSDDEAPEVAIKSDRGSSQDLLLPDDYKVDVITRVLEMCSINNYANLVDFDWYIDILIQLVRNAPVTSSSMNQELEEYPSNDISEKIGDELRNVAVKVKAVRSQAAKAAESILILAFNDTTSQVSSGNGALRPISWMIGEYASYLESPENTMAALLHITKASTSAEGLIVYLQALAKVFAVMADDEHSLWTAERKTMMSLLMARIINALEPLAMHPDLEVQERAVEFSELLKLAAEATNGQGPSSESVQQDAPLLLTQALPSLFRGQELNSVAASAQKNVPLPSNLDLDQPINQNLHNLLRNVDSISFDDLENDEFEVYYHQKPEPTSISSNEPAINRLSGSPDQAAQSYQQGSEESYLDPDIVARRKAERLERNRDDPFYIAPNDGSLSGTSTPLHNILQNNNGQDLDIDAIPIMQLDLGKTNLNITNNKKPSKKPRQRIQVAADETLNLSGTSTPANDSENSTEGAMKARLSRGKQSLLQVDSSHIGQFSLEGDDTSGIDFERQQKEEAEMVKAMKEVERLRLEMQRANERIHAAQDVPPEGTVVKRKAKKKTKPAEGEAATVVKKRKKAKKAVVDEGEGEPSVAPTTTDVVKPKKKKKKPKMEEEVMEQA